MIPQPSALPMTSHKPRVQVVAGILMRDEQFLIARRKAGMSLAGFWEFPGGKLEPDESPEQALQRELKEEFSIDVTVGDYVGRAEYDYDHIRIELIAYRAFIDEGEFELTDHDAIEWVTVERARTFELAPADIPILDQLAGS